MFSTFGSSHNLHTRELPLCASTHFVKTLCSRKQQDMFTDCLLTISRFKRQSPVFICTSISVFFFCSCHDLSSQAILCSLQISVSFLILLERNDSLVVRTLHASDIPQPPHILSQKLSDTSNFLLHAVILAPFHVLCWVQV